VPPKSKKAAKKPKKAPKKAKKRAPAKKKAPKARKTPKKPPEPRLTPDQKEELALLEMLAWRDRVVDALYPIQQKIWHLVRDKVSRRIAVKVPRRGGKTWCIASIMCRDAIGNPGSLYLYIALSKSSTQNIVLPILKELNLMYEWGGVFKEIKGIQTMVFPNGRLSPKDPYDGGSQIQLYGADREDLHDRLLGLKCRMVCVDEGAAWRSDLRYFVKQVIEPTLMDLRGFLFVVGAPGPILRGFFYDLTKPDHHCTEDAPREPGWAFEEWRTEDNPAVATEFEELKQEWAAADNTYKEKLWYRIQWCGEWLADLKDNVYDFDPEVHGIPSFKTASSAKYVMGMDTGWSAGMAYVVSTYDKSKHDKWVVLESDWCVQQNNDEIAAQINHYRDKYKSLLVVGDPNNAQLNNELRRRYKIPLLDAEKTDKKDWMRTINTDYQQGRIAIVGPETSNQALCTELVQLKKKFVRGGEQWEEHGDNHCGDAHLYAFRYCYQFLHRPKKPKPKHGTTAWLREKAAKLKEQRMKQVRQASRSRYRRSRWG